MIAETYKGTVKCGEKVVTFEGPREFVDEEVLKVLKLATPAEKEKPSPSALRTGASPQGISESEFIRKKQPKRHEEIVAVVAFLLTEQGHVEFTEEEIRRAYIRAGQRPPKVVSQALRDAKNKFDYLERGSKPGRYRLSSHGETTVRFDLPRQRAQ